MFKLILSVSALGAVFTGAWPFVSTPAIPAVPTIPPVSLEVPVENPGPGMWSKQKTVYQGDYIELQFAPQHAGYLGVLAPDGRFFYLIYPLESSVGALTPIMDSRDFIQKTSLVLSTGTLRADPYTHGVLENQPVFTQSGTYRFILGENLHTDDETALDIVKVRYEHKASPNKKAFAG
jgi:hypothetical protein